MGRQSKIKIFLHGEGPAISFRWSICFHWLASIGLGLLILAAPMSNLAQSDGIRQRGIGVRESGNKRLNGWYAASHALVIGIDDYSHGWSRLGEAVADAKRMVTVLEQHDFTVHTLFNKQATFQGIIQTLRKMAAKTDRHGRFVVYYSGHGFTKKSKWDATAAGYLVPVEGKSGDISNYISVNQLREEILNHCQAKHVLVILDSCFSGTLLTRAGIADGLIEDYLRKRGVYGITAGMQDQPVIDGLFTAVLVKALQGNADYNGDGFVTFKEIGMYTEQNVGARNRLQTPDFGVMYGSGQIVFRLASRPENSAGNGYRTPDMKAYGALLKDAEKIEIQKKEDAEEHKQYLEKLEDAWSTVYKVARMEAVPASKRRESVANFLEDFHLENRHRLQAEKLLKSIDHEKHSLKLLNQGDSFSDLKPVEIKTFDSGIQALDFSSGGDLFIEGGCADYSDVLCLRGGVHVRSIDTFEIRVDIPFHLGAVSSVAFSPNDKQIASGGYDKTILISRIKDGRTIFKLQGHKRDVNSLAYSPDGRILASGSMDETIRLWNLSDGSLLSVLKGHRGFVNKLAFSPDGELLASVGSDGRLIIWGGPRAEKLHTIKNKSSLTAIAFSPNSKWVAVGSDSGQIMIYEAMTGQSKTKLEGYPNPVSAITFISGNLLAETGKKRGVRLWDLSTASPVSWWKVPKGTMYTLAYHQEKRILLGGGTMPNLYLWKLP